MQVAKQPLSPSVRTGADAIFSETALKLPDNPRVWEIFYVDYVKARGPQFYVRVRVDGVKTVYSSWVKVYWVIPS